MVLAGFLFACKWHINWSLLLSAVFGTALVIGSACAFNNYLDRGIDSKMERTKKRALAAGKIPAKIALAYASLLGLAGFTLLLAGTNFTAAAVAWAGYVVYILVYTPLKRRTVYSTIVGSVAGSMPPVIGYVAVSGHLDASAAILF